MAHKVVDNFNEYDCELFDKTTLEGDSCYLNVECYSSFVDDDDISIPENFNPYCVDIILV